MKQEEMVMQYCACASNGGTATVNVITQHAEYLAIIRQQAQTIQHLLGLLEKAGCGALTAKGGCGDGR